jgi:hypothetical protein
LIKHAMIRSSHKHSGVCLELHHKHKTHVTPTASHSTTPMTGRVTEISD